LTNCATPAVNMHDYDVSSSKQKCREFFLSTLLF
jgi:hypothetical protein